MKLKVLKCPECRANFEIEECRSSCFCSFCGAKIMLDDEKQEITITEHYINEAEVIEAKSKSKNRKRKLILSIATPLAAIIFFVGIFASAKISSNVEEKRLQTIVNDVLIDIENGDFEEAYVKASTIQYTSNWSDDTKKKWDETRAALIEQIKKAEKVKLGALLTPAAAQDYKNKSYTKALEDFENAGFTNIKLEVIYDLYFGLFVSDGEIESVIINGSSEFSKDEICPKDSVVVIKYHTWTDSEPKISMPYASSDYCWNGYLQWSAEEIVAHFEDLGFTDVETKTTKDTLSFHDLGEISSVSIEDTLLGGWSKGDVFKSASKITVTYYERTPTLTIDNCPEFAKLLSDEEKDYNGFAKKFDEQFIEFEAYVTGVTLDISKNVSSLSVCGVEVANKMNDGVVAGIVIHLDMQSTAGNKNNIRGVEKGSIIRVIAKVDDYYTDYYNTLYVKAAYVENK